MTKKDFEAIADAIRLATSEANPALVHKATLKETLCRYFSERNPRFNAGRFSEACYAKETVTSA